MILLLKGVMLPCSLLLSLLIFAFSATASERLIIVGSTTVLPIVAQAAKFFRKLNPDSIVTVSGGGSGVGVASVKQGAATIGMVSRDLSEVELSSLDEKIEVIPVARDAVAVAVSEPVYLSGVTQLSIAQIADIYRGKIKNWQAVGGFDKPILVIDKEPSRGTRHVFAKVVLGSGRARANGASIIVGSNNEEQATIANSDKAIGMLSNAWLNEKVRAVAVINAEGAMLPTLENVADGRYPLQRTLNLILSENVSNKAREFVAFLLSDQGQGIVQEVGYLPVH